MQIDYSYLPGHIRDFSPYDFAFESFPRFIGQKMMMPMIIHIGTRTAACEDGRSAITLLLMGGGQGD